MKIDNQFDEEPMPESLSIISWLVIIGLIVIGVYKWNTYAIEHPIICTPYRVTEIGQCTEATSNAWSGTDTGSCRVQLSNGSRVNMKAPVMLGDTHRICVK